jgi:alcohol dehydrogenase class IV
MEKFHCKTKIFAGSGAIDALKDLRISRLFLVCDPYFHENGTAQKVVNAAKSPDHCIFSQIMPDPTVELAARGAAQMRNFCPDTVVALGGGSTMDAAKAMVYFSGIQAPLIAIPTTSGSGSEVTDFAILTHDDVKHPLVDDRLKPDIAILDSELVRSLPQRLIAEGGFDLISHALEAYVATNRSSLSDLLAEEAFRRAMQGLKRSAEGDLHWRAQLHTAATMAGMAFSQAGLGLCHAISHSLGGEFHIPHGRLNAILLPAVIECNASACGREYARLAISAQLSAGGEAMALRALKNKLTHLRKELHLPENLLQAGLSPADIQCKLNRIVSAVLADPCCATNPVKPNEDMVRDILVQVMGHG